MLLTVLLKTICNNTHPTIVRYSNRGLNSFFVVIFSLVGLQAIAQDDVVTGGRRGSRVIDDTTKQIYGPNTSKYFYESDVFFNKLRLYPIDTLIKNFHRYNYVQQNNNLYQDLGVIGTAIQPIYYKSPDVIGARSGAHVYDLYWDSEPVRYYDTKSPYSNMRVILGGKGRSITKATFSRNINPRWNFGFTYRGFLIDKQIFRKGKGDRVVKSNYYDAYTAYRSKDSAYHLFVNFRRGFHRVFEFGGVKLKSSDTLDLKGYFKRDARPWLTAAESNDLRMNFHLFHQYSIGRGLQLYNTFDRYRQKNIFLDVKNTDTSKFFDFVEIDKDKVRDVSKFKAVRTEAGIKGNLGKLFYNGYYAVRYYSMSYNNLWWDTLDVKARGYENYLGGRMALQLDSLNEVSGWLEVTPDGYYRLNGEITSKWFEARLKHMRYSPGFIPQVYRGAHDYWEKNLANIESTQINGYVHYRASTFRVSPGLTLTRLRNYVYFRKTSHFLGVQQVLPFQSSGNQVIASPEMQIAITFFRHITWTNQAIYTTLIENSDKAIWIPKLFINSQLAYENIFFGGNLDMQTGVDVHWKSAYYAMGYDPAIRQFYTQTDFEAPSFPIVDLFFSAKIKRGRVFFKYNNLIQAFTKSGYFPTPYYPGQSNVLDFGFDWSFYD